MKQTSINVGCCEGCDSIDFDYISNGDGDKDGVIKITAKGINFSWIERLVFLFSPNPFTCRVGVLNAVQAKVLQEFLSSNTEENKT